MTVVHQVSLSVEFSSREYWSRLPFATPGDPPDPGIEPVSLALAGRFFTTVLSWKPRREKMDSEFFLFKFNMEDSHISDVG